MTRQNLRHAASTLAFHWAEGQACHMDRIGVERLLCAYPVAVQCILCGMIMEYLRTRDGAHHADSFQDMLFDLAMIGGAS